MTNPRPARLTSPAAAAACADAIQRAADAITASAAQDAHNPEYVASMYLAVAQSWLDLATALAERQAMNPLPPADGEGQW